MIPKYAHSLGGKKTAKIFRDKAIEDYYKDPCICLSCNALIDINDSQKVSQVRQKKFCNRSCAATFNNRGRKKIKVSKVKKLGIKKGLTWKWLLTKTKDEVFASHKNWQSARTSIRRHAQFVFDNNIKDKTCRNCGYDKHVEICHIKSVSSFSGNSIISDINNKNNLIPLCPNCHWEYDNKLLDISGWSSGSSGLS